MAANKFLHVIIGFILLTGIPSGDKHDKLKLSGDEYELYEQIMSYRKARGLKKINLSASLTYVARIHARDLSENRPFDDYCNLHSWSDNGDWTACCYTDDHEEAGCMWYKPFELTGFKGMGYEIVYYSTYPEDHIDFPGSVLDGWKKSKSHNQVLINRGEWKSLEWKSIGIGIDGPFAVVWFSDTEDKGILLRKKD